jgi:CRP-like cAMP-binding protein
VEHATGAAETNAAKIALTFSPAAKRGNKSRGGAGSALQLMRETAAAGAAAAPTRPLSPQLRRLATRSFARSASRLRKMAAWRELLVVNLTAVILPVLGSHAGVISPNFRMVQLLRVLSLPRFFERLGYVKALSAATGWWLRTFVVVIIAVCWSSAILCVVSNDGLPPGTAGEVLTWEHKIGAADAVGEEPYRGILVAIHFNVMTVATVGYRAFSDGTYVQIFCIAFQLLFVYAYAFIVEQTSQQVNKENWGRIEYYQRMENLKAFLRHKKLPLAVKARISDFFRHAWLHATDKLGDGAFLGELPHSLTVAVQKFVHADVIAAVHWFDMSSADSEAVVLHLLACMTPMSFAPTDTIIWEGDMGDQAYFLKNGIVQVRADHRVIVQIDSAQCFGEVGLLRDTLRTASVIAITMCDVLELTRRDFDSVLKHFPEIGGLLRDKVMRTVKVLQTVLSRWRTRASNSAAHSGAARVRAQGRIDEAWSDLSSEQGTDDVGNSLFQPHDATDGGSSGAAAVRSHARNDEDNETYDRSEDAKARDAVDQKEPVFDGDVLLALTEAASTASDVSYEDIDTDSDFDDEAWSPEAHEMALAIKSMSRERPTPVRPVRMWSNAMLLRNFGEYCQMRRATLYA